MLFEDGRLIREDYNISMPIIKNCLTDDFEDLVINSPDLVKAIKQLINENKEELKNLLSKHIANPGICDGASETFRFGRMKIEGSNILTVSMEGYEEALKKYNALVAAGDKEAAEKALPQTFAILDEMVTKGIIHKNKADRQKSNLSSKLAKLSK